eukprot:1138144-Pelagomonas_calceolata.AAC.2
MSKPSHTCSQVGVMRQARQRQLQAGRMWAWPVVPGLPLPTPTLPGQHKGVRTQARRHTSGIIQADV